MNKIFDELTLVLVSYKSKKKVLNFIKSLSKKFTIIIVENSNDKSIETGIKEINKKIKVIFSENRGYGSAINYARKFIKTKFFFVFNPDIIGITDKFLLDFYKSANEIKYEYGSLGPRFNNVNEKSHKQSNINKKFGEIESISGSAMFFKTDVFDYNNGFDENFFLYFEETDYCRRSNRNGFRNYQINNLFVLHDIGTSVEIENEIEKNKLKELCLWHFIWSKYYFSTKVRGHLLSKIFFSPIILKILFRIFIYSLMNRQDKKRKYKIRLDALIHSIKRTSSYKRINDF